MPHLWMPDKEVLPAEPFQIRGDHVSKFWIMGDLTYTHESPQGHTIGYFRANPQYIDEDSLPAASLRNIAFTWSVTASDGTAFTLVFYAGSLTTAHAYTGQTAYTGGQSSPYPAQETVYRIVASHSVSRSITIPVYKDPVITSFSRGDFVRNPCLPGANVGLNWTVSGKPSPTISIDNGIGTVSDRHTVFNLATGVGTGSIRHYFGVSGARTLTMTISNRQHNNQEVVATKTLVINVP